MSEGMKMVILLIVIHFPVVVIVKFLSFFSFIGVIYIVIIFIMDIAACYDSAFGNQE